MAFKLKLPQLKKQAAKAPAAEPQEPTAGDGPFEEPDVEVAMALPAAPRVKALNKAGVVAFLGLGGVLVVGGVVLFMASADKEQTKQKEELHGLLAPVNGANPQTGSAIGSKIGSGARQIREWYDDMPQGSLVPAAAPSLPTPASNGPATPAAAAPVLTPQKPGIPQLTAAPGTGLVGGTLAYNDSQQQVEQQRVAAENQRRSAMLKAYNASPEVAGWRGLSAQASQAQAQAQPQYTAASGPAMAMPSAAGRSTAAAMPVSATASTMAAAPGGGFRPASEGDASRQADKEAFMAKLQSEPTEPYLRAVRAAPLSEYELKAGSVIPAALVTTANTDLPGQLIGQVTQNVYDSAWGRHLLIPQGSRLLGTYDNRVTLGQERILVAWQRLVFPDGSSVSLAGMQGADTAGAAGFTDEVDNHYFRTFGAAMLMTVLNAGTRLLGDELETDRDTRLAVAEARLNAWIEAHPGTGSSAPQPPSSLVEAVAKAKRESFGEAVAKGSVDAVVDIGSKHLDRLMEMQPTLQARNGYKFNVIVSKDMMFLGPYQER